MLRAVKWGALSGLVLFAGIVLSAAVVALVGSQVADQLSSLARVLWFAYLGLLLALPSAVVLRLLDQAEAFGKEGLERVSEDVMDMPLESDKKPSSKEKALEDLLLLRRRLYRFLVKAWFVFSVLAGFYVGLGLLATAWGGWLGLLAAAFPFAVAAFAYYVFRVLRNSRKDSSSIILRHIRPILAHLGR